MAFSESIKLSVKQKANFTCCWCNNRQNKIEVHHIVPQAEGGPDDEDNAAPLCGSCHDLYGGNPNLKKEIRLRRDHWYETCSKVNNPDNRQAVDLDVFHSDLDSLKIEEPLTTNIISSHANASAWNQGAPLSPFEFVIKLDLLNQSRKPIILKSFEISAFDAPHNLLNQSLPIGRLFIVKDANKKSPATFPYQIPSEYFGLIEYRINVQLDDQERLNFVPDSDAFQNYSIELSYEYYDTTRVTYTASILVQDTFQEFKDAWLEAWNSYQQILLRRGVIDNIARVSLESFEQPIIPDNNDKWVSIKIVNNEKEHLTNCYGVLEVDGMPLQLGWSAGSSGVKDIFGGSSELLDIARTLKEKGMFAFTTQKRCDWPEKKPGRYRIKATIGGDFKGQTFTPILFEGYIEYKGGTDLFLIDGSKPFPS